MAVSDAQPDESGKNQSKDAPPKRKWVPYAVFALVVLLALILHRCQDEPKLEMEPLQPPPSVAVPEAPAPIESLPPEPETIPEPPPPPKAEKTLPKPEPKPEPAQVMAPVDSVPYLYADPWGGRHFDSVSVSLFCREDCLILYAVGDSIHFKTYDEPIMIRRSTPIWITAYDGSNRQVAPVRIDYAIDRDPGYCGQNMMPFPLEGREICMDKYEWPNREGELPTAFVNQAEAADSCAAEGKRLCSLEEWQSVCRGPETYRYPYGRHYNQNHCPAKERGASRSGRFPACRSYYGTYDMTGNVWEWTDTPAEEREGFFMVAGGNWTTGNQATCGQSK